VILFESEAWVIKKENATEINSAEMKFSRSFKGCTRTDRIMKYEIGRELWIYFIEDRMKEYRARWLEY
jgi:hypothetical protein